MNTKAVRLYGKKDLRLEEFELPAISDDEILAHVISNSICMSTYKETMLGADATIHLPNIPGGKKLIYTNIDLELTALDDFKKKGENNPLFAGMAKITAKTQGLWSGEAEKYLLANANPI